MRLPYNLTRPGRITMALLLLYCLAELANIWMSVRYLEFYTVVGSGTLTQVEMAAATAAVESIDILGAVAGVFLLVMAVACIIASSIWIYRASRNAAVLMPNDARITPGWAVGWFFVPFVNLVMPYRAMRQTWNGLNGTGALNKAMPLWALIWWVLWMVSNAVNAISTRVFLQADTFADFRKATIGGIVASIFGLIATVLFLNLIRELTRASAQASVSPQS